MTLGQLQDLVNVVLTNNNMEAAENISEETRLREDLGMDSFQLAELTVRIEEQTRVDVFSDGLVNTVGELMGKLQ